MQLIINYSASKEPLSIEAEASDTTIVVKQKIYQRLNLNPEDVTEFNLICRGKILEDDRTLSDYNIDKDECSDLYLRVKMRNKSITEIFSNAVSSFWNINNSRPQHIAQQVIPAIDIQAHAPANIPAAAELPNYRLSEQVDSDSDIPDTGNTKPLHR